MSRLKKLLPVDCKPIIITDAGFRNPWFKSVLSLGWDFVGRVRGNAKYYDGQNWVSCKSILLKATATAQYLGNILLCKSNTLHVHLYRLKEKLKKRTRIKKQSAKIKKSRSDSQHRKSGKEAWLLCSSLSGENALKIKRIIKIYKFRMQIEEGFRDLKSSKYGFGFEKAHSRSCKRVRVLLLIAMLASLIAWLAGFIAEKNKWHYQFQTNTVKSRRVLSLFFLGCRVIKRNIKISKDMFEAAIQESWRIAA